MAVKNLLRSVESNLRFYWFCFVSLGDWPRKLETKSKLNQLRLGRSRFTFFMVLFHVSIGSLI